MLVARPCHEPLTHLRCTITTHRSIAGTPASVSSTSGTATLNGRFAQRPPTFDELHIPVELHRVGLHDAHRARAGDHFLERGHERAIELDGEHVGPGGGECDRERSEPRPDLDHPVARPHAGLRGDRAREFGSIRKC